MINPITALIYLLFKKSLEKDPEEIKLLNEVENELDKVDSENFEKAKEQTRKIYPVELIEKDENVFLKSIDKISEYQELLNIESEKEIVEKYKLTPKQFKDIKEKRFIRKAKEITQASQNGFSNYG